MTIRQDQFPLLRKDGGCPVFRMSLNTVRQFLLSLKCTSVYTSLKAWGKLIHQVMDSIIKLSWNFKVSI